MLQHKYTPKGNTQPLNEQYMAANSLTKHACEFLGVHLWSESFNTRVFVMSLPTCKSFLTALVILVAFDSLLLVLFYIEPHVETATFLVFINIFLLSILFIIAFSSSFSFFYFLPKCIQVGQKNDRTQEKLQKKGKHSILAKSIMS